jgi:hypothetical protein
LMITLGVVIFHHLRHLALAYSYLLSDTRLSWTH